MAPARKNDYRSIMIKLINYLDGRDLPKEAMDDGRVTQDRLLLLTPTDIMGYFNHYVFGVENPGVNFGNMQPTKRLNSIEYMKKAMSSFMPNRLIAWNVQTSSGNPTRCTELNNLIKYISKKQSRSQGAEAQARSPLKKVEAETLISMLKHPGQNAQANMYGIPAMINYQFHMIARIDDVTMVECNNLQASDGWDFVLKTRLPWSKNVTEERDAPWQFVLASMDPQFDVHSSLAVWLEYHPMQFPPGANTPYLFNFSGDDSIPRGGNKSRDIVSNKLRGVFHSDEFLEVSNGEKKGTHSVRKWSSTHCRLNGCSKDDKDYRGRWKQKRVSDVYDDVELPYVDAKTAAALCHGGACRYAIRPNSGITNTFILTQARGCTANTAIDRIYQVYGPHQPVTKIINAMWKDRNYNRLHISLR